MKHFLIILTVLWVASASAQYPAGKEVSAPSHSLTRDAAHSIGIHRPTYKLGSTPINDNCSDAIVLTVHPYGSCPGLSTAGDNTDATQANSDICDITTSQIQDVWYTFTTGAEYSAIITLNPGNGMSDWALGIYDGCGGTAIYCIAQPIGALLFPLQPATTYWLSIWSNNDYGTTGEFDLCIEAPPAPPANDLCSDAVPQPMSVGDTWAFTGDATGAANTENVAYNSVWHAVTLTEPADLTIDLCGSDATDLLGLFYRSIYLTCPPNYVDRVWAGSYDVTTCVDDRLTLCYAKLDAGTYYLPVAPPIEAGDGYIMNVRADTYGSHVPSNDDCDGATPLIVGATCDLINYLPECATQTLPAIDCGVPDANANDDVWHSFTAPSDLVTLAVFAHSNGFSPVIDVYSGSCGTLSAYDCVDAAALDITAQLNLFGLNTGETYFFRVYNGYGTTPLDDASYDLCAVEGDEVVIGLEENVNTERLGLFPNPSDGNVTIQVDPRATVVDLTVVDGSGRIIVKDTSTRASGGSVVWELASVLSSGIYIVRVDDGLCLREHRLMVDR